MARMLQDDVAGRGAEVARVASPAGNQAVRRLIVSSGPGPDVLQRAVWKMHLPPKRYRKQGVEYFMKEQREKALKAYESQGASKKEALARFKKAQKEGSYTKEDALQKALAQEQRDRGIVDRGASNLATKGYDKVAEKEVGSAKRLGAVLTAPTEDPRLLRNIPSDETVYFIAHGSGTTVGGMTPSELAKILEKNLPSTYRGKIKLVSCHSGEDVPGVGSFAGSLAGILAGSKKVRPASVDGIQGFGVVTGGRIGAEKPDPAGDVDARMRPVADPELQKIYQKIVDSVHDKKVMQAYERQYRLLAEQKGYFGEAAKPRWTVNADSEALLEEAKKERKEKAGI